MPSMTLATWSNAVVKASVRSCLTRANACPAWLASSLADLTSACCLRSLSCIGVRICQMHVLQQSQNLLRRCLTRAKACPAWLASSLADVTSACCLRSLSCSSRHLCQMMNEAIKDAA